VVFGLLLFFGVGRGSDLLLGVELVGMVYGLLNVWFKVLDGWITDPTPTKLSSLATQYITNLPFDQTVLMTKSLTRLTTAT